MKCQVNSKSLFGGSVKYHEHRALNSAFSQKFSTKRMYSLMVLSLISYELSQEGLDKL